MIERGVSRGRVLEVRLELSRRGAETQRSSEAEDHFLCSVIQRVMPTLVRTAETLGEESVILLCAVAPQRENLFCPIPTFHSAPPSTHSQHLRRTASSGSIRPLTMSGSAVYCLHRRTMAVPGLPGVGAIRRPFCCSCWSRNHESPSKAPASGLPCRTRLQSVIPPAPGHRRPTP
jgi:hypothetical protein